MINSIMRELKRRRKVALLTGIAIAATFGLVLCQVGQAPAQPGANIPFVTVTNVGTGTAVQIIGSNPSRRALTICTNASTNALTIIPAPLTPISLTTGITIVGTATQSSCFTLTLVQNSGTSGGVGNAWNAISAGSAQNVTVLEY